MITGRRPSALRMWPSVVRPSISGISMSSVTRSGRSCSILASASTPFAAVPTTSMSVSLSSARVISRRMTTESSTTSTRALATSVVPEELVFEAEQRELLGEGVHRERLDRVLVGAGHQRAGDVRRLALGRHHEQLGALVVRNVAHGADELEAVHHRHVPIDEHEVDGAEAGEVIDPLAAVAGFEHLVSALGQQTLQHRPLSARVV